jgi:creatinine amidohydrolase
MAEVEWVNLKAYELRDLATRDAVVVVPVGSTEQHGPHLPVQVDALLAGEVSRQAARRAWDTAPVVVMPPVWTGLAEHHMSLGGTITLDYATFAALLHGICHSIARHGFRRILILNGHGGNITGLNVLTGELAQEVDAVVAMACYWTIDAAAEAFAVILDMQSNVRHAGEAETSMLLALRPDLVDMDAAARIDPPLEGLSARGAAYRWRPIAHWSESGVIGAPAAATAEKGERLLAAAAQAVADTILDAALWADHHPRARG